MLRYLKGTANQGLVLGAINNRELYLDELVGWADADYAGDVKTRRSTTGGVLQIMGSTIYCRSALQKSVATSTMEAEYMSLCDLTKEVVWTLNILADMGVRWRNGTQPVLIREDNQACIATLTNPGANHTRSNSVQPSQMPKRRPRARQRQRSCAAATAIKDIVSFPVLIKLSEQLQKFRSN